VQSTRRPELREPPNYTDQELETERLTAIEIFIKERHHAGDTEYRETHARNRSLVQRLLSATDNLLCLDGRVIADDPILLRPASFLASLPVSEDDLDTLVGHSIAKRRTLPVELAQAACQILETMVDPIRFPWVRERRAPSTPELDKAVDWTAGILTVEQLRTDRRTESAQRQQNAVIKLLTDIGWVERQLARIDFVDDLPRGCFCRETQVADSKCDVPVRLGDGRILLLECKVSNSSTNSVKRLIRETCGKAANWRRAFGKQAITGAVLAGVFKLVNLKQAQNDYGLVIFSEHDLTRLRDFMTNC
jgi:hypothetical protein